jgi:lipoyl-dependent peroxiredoxin subunit C
MLTVGNTFPQFDLEACVSREPGKEFKQVASKDVQGKWMVVFYWPKDFTFVCPTEIAAFNSAQAEFESRKAVLLGASTDTAYVHLAWRENHPDLKNLKFPMLSDHAKRLSGELGILTGKDQVALRATFVVDPEGTIRWVNVNDLDVGRSVEETLRVLDALQTGVKTPCNWHKGEKTL